MQEVCSFGELLDFETHIGQRTLPYLIGSMLYYLNNLFLKYTRSCHFKGIKRFIILYVIKRALDTRLIIFTSNLL